MRLHRDDVGPGPDEPAEGWERPSEAPSASLSDALDTWSVVRRWRGVKARTATEAMRLATLGEHDHTHATRQQITMLYLTKDELDVLLTSIATSLTQTERNLNLAEAEQTTSVLRYKWQVLNSLRTAVSEARYDLMTPEEIEISEHAAWQAARDAGVIAADDPPSSPAG